VEISASNCISVATRDGSAEVRNSSGVLVASLRSGVALTFEPQAADATGALKITGTLESHDGKFFLTDTTTNVRFELQGTDLAQYVGKQVEIIGSSIPGATAAGGASQVAQVITVKSAGRGAAGAAAGGGLSRGATAAIVGGVAVVGAAVGLAAAGTFSKAATLSNQ